MFGGETGIRTLDPPKRITVFETAPIGHSGISPKEEVKKRKLILELLLESQRLDRIQFRSLVGRIITRQKPHHDAHNHAHHHP